MTINGLQTQVDDWIKQHGVRYFNELTNLGILMEEVGELSRIMVRRYGEQSEKESDKGKDIGDEMCDILWVLTALANQCNVNLEEAMARNLEKKTQRDAYASSPKRKAEVIPQLLPMKCNMLLRQNSTFL
jgi:NTP pyrophosphatase (non-canonical NTP hydrolase)